MLVNVRVVLVTVVVEVRDVLVDVRVVLVADVLVVVQVPSALHSVHILKAAVTAPLEPTPDASIESSSSTAAAAETLQHRLLHIEEEQS